jgi:flagellar hook assembly protein FlgD
MRASILNLRAGVFDVQGRRVRDLWMQNPGTGTYVFDWVGTNSQGSRLSSGRYWIRLSGPGRSQAIDLLMPKQ